MHKLDGFKDFSKLQAGIDVVFLLRCDALGLRAVYVVLEKRR